MVLLRRMKIQSNPILSGLLLLCLCISGCSSFSDDLVFDETSTQSLLIVRIESEKEASNVTIRKTDLVSKQFQPDTLELPVDDFSPSRLETKSYNLNSEYRYFVFNVASGQYANISRSWFVGRSIINPETQTECRSSDAPVFQLEPGSVHIVDLSVSPKPITQEELQNLKGPLADKVPTLSQIPVITEPSAWISFQRRSLNGQFLCPGNLYLDAIRYKKETTQ